jgi:hypothetical protein
MLCKMLRHANPVSLRNLFFTSVVICLAIFVPACSQDPAKDAGSSEPREGEHKTVKDAGSIELREGEYKTAKHPEKDYFAKIWPSGLQVLFNTAQGHFGQYDFPHEEFPLGESTSLLCPGSPQLLPMRVVRLNGEAEHKYKIEWLAESPGTSDGGRKIVRSR